MFFGSVFNLVVFGTCFFLVLSSPIEKLVGKTAETNVITQSMLHIDKKKKKQAAKTPQTKNA